MDRTGALILLAALAQGLVSGMAVAPVPRFTRPHYHVTVPENSAARTYVGQPARMGVALTDRRWDLRFKIVAGDGENLFKAEELVLGDFCFLRLRTKAGNAAVLNREVRDRYVLTVQALERRSGAQAQAQVLVRVLDANDLRPLFSPTSYSAALPDDTAPGTSVARVSATDADLGTNGQFYYSFRQRSDTFAIHPTSGVVVLTGRLDHTQTPRYELDVLAADRGRRLYGGGGDGGGGVSSLARLTVRVEPADTCVPALTVDLRPVGAGGPGEPAGAAPLAMVTVEDCDVGPSQDVAALSIVAGDPLGLFRAIRVAPGGREFWIQSIKALDWARHPAGFNLSLQAQDGGSPPRAVSAVRLFHLPPPPPGAAPQPFHFEEDVYRARVLDFAPPGTLVAVVRAVPDSPSLRYVLAGSAGGTSFQLHPRTGLLSTREPLPARTPAQLELRVATADGRASTRVLVQVVGSNRHAPEFAQAAYRATFDENAPAGTSVVRVEASDLDTGEDGQVTYSLAQAVPGPFSVDPFTGEVRTTEALDYELVPRIYTIRVRASDRGRPFRRETEVPVTLTLLNLNDNAPLFERVDCQAAVPRDQALGVPVATLSAIDADELQLVRYRLDAGDPLGLFHLDPGSGVLSLRQPLGSGPGAPTGPFDLRVLATDGEHASVPLRINVTVTAPGRPLELRCRETGVARMLAQKLLQADRRSAHPRAGTEAEEVPAPAVNAHTPHFWSGPPAAVAVSEAVPVGSVVAQLNASDADCGYDGKVVYALSGGNDAGHFTVDVESGLLRVLSPLDREAQDEYTLNVTAFDLGIPQRAAWRLLGIQILDANDNRPEFHRDSYEVAVSEAAEPGGVLVQLEATDRDLGPNGEVRYGLLSDTDQFSIDATMGEVRLAGPLDREARAVHVLRVAAWDQAEEGQRLSSTAVLTVTVEDVNDNAPACIPPLQRVRVREDLPEGALVTWLEARDLDLGPAGQVRFSLLEAGAGFFELDRLSGALRLVRPLDFEMRQLYNLTVRARDKGRPLALSATCHVEVEVVDVDENLHSPVFASFAVGGVVREDAPVGTSVLTLSARDEDVGRDGRIRYSIRDGSGLGVFRIDEEKGTIEMAAQLDRETMTHYWLTVYATDQGATPLSSFTEVYIEVEDVNDNAPLTTQPVYHPAVPENSPKDVSVVQIEASDPDAGDQLSFRITSGNPQGFFAIHPKTGTGGQSLLHKFWLLSGHCLCNRSMSEVLGRPECMPGIIFWIRNAWKENGVYHFSHICAHIQTKCTVNTSTIFLLLNLEICSASRSDLSLDSLCPSPHLFPSPAVTAAPTLPRLLNCLCLIPGNVGNAFTIDPVLGSLRTARELDRRRHREYTLVVRAVDRGLPPLSAETTAHVLVTLSDDDAPRFSAGEYAGEVSEAAPAGTPVAEVTASSRSAVFYELSSGNEGDAFSVNPHSGVITTRRGLDFEVQASYLLEVRATNMAGQAAQATVRVRLRDENDHAPVFPQAGYTGLVSEAAVDEDSGTNAMLSYHIVEAPARGFFTIDTRTGAVRTGASLDYEHAAVIRFTVQAQDAGSPRLVAEHPAHVIVRVVDVNDCPPVFSLPLYEALLLLPTYPDVQVLTLSATDADAAASAPLAYTIADGNVGQAFHLDGRSGVLSVWNATGLRSRYELTVRVSDGRFSDTTVVRVLVRQGPVGPLHFSQSSYKATVLENSTEPRDVVMVTLPGRPINEPLIFRILNPDGRFRLGPTSGVLSTTGVPFDREQQAAFDVVVEATEAGREPGAEPEPGAARAHVLVRVAVEDVNDNMSTTTPPRFNQMAYATTLSEAAAVGTLVVWVRAADADLESGRGLTYHLDAGLDDDLFLLDQDSGAITLVGPLDYEQAREHQLLIRAVDGGRPPLSAEVLVTVTVSNLNDHLPLFDQPLYEATVGGLAAPGHLVTRVAAIDADGPGLLEYAIVAGDRGRLFSMDTTSGVITLAGRLPSPPPPTYELNVSVSDGVFRSETRVRVAVTGANQHAPTFAQSELEAELAESAPAGTLVATAEATDKDVGPYGLLAYSIVNAFAAARFRVDARGRLFTIQELDRENPSERVVPVRLMARDGGGRAAFCTVSVILTDTNDHAPRFRAAIYEADVDAGTPRGKPVLTVLATDADEGSNADVTYALEADASRARELLAIDPRLGIISVRETLVGLDGQVLSFSVQARDGGSPPLATAVPVRVRVLPPDVRLPHFAEPFYSFAVPEDLPLGSEIGTLRADLGGAALDYSLDRGPAGQDNDPSEVFAVDRRSGRLTLLRSLDHEASRWYQITVRARGRQRGHEVTASVDVSIRVGDVNDNSPMPEADPYAASVAENRPVGSPVVQVRASDPDLGPNGQVQYALDPAQDRAVLEAFAVHPDSGWLTTLRELDREERATFRVLVVASDCGERERRSSTATVEVTVADENDNPPRFSAEVYKGTVSEADPSGGVVAVLSSSDADADEMNRRVTYYITGGDPQGQFAVEQAQDEWRVFVQRALDREEKDSYLLNVTATDGTFTAGAVVEVKVLDANDNSPVCDKTLYTETIPEDSLPGRLITQVSATDADIRTNAEITYTLSGPGAENFNLHPETGELKTFGPLDREQQATYNLLVTATDGGGRSCCASVQLWLDDVNDNAPVFTADPFTATVFENTEPRTPLTRIQATDADTGLNGKIRYTLVPPADSHFSVDADSGIVWLERSLDREVQAVHTLTVRAVDRGPAGQLSATATLVVSVLDINDNPPEFEYREYGGAVAEDVPVGTEVLRVYAASRDVEANAEITYAIVGGNEHGRFGVDAATGAVFVSASLDYEQARDYCLTVEATDGGSPPLSDVATVNINVTDINDHAPVFSQDSYTAVVSEDAAPDQSILTVAADDADGPSNSLIHYSIVDGNGGGRGTPFIIDPAKGHVILTGPLDRETVSGYTLTIRASDNGHPPRVTTTTANIDVSDVNDNPPLFSPANHSIILQENKPVGFSVLQLEARDRDSSHNGPPFVFTIESGNEEGVFRLDADGLLTTAAPLDRRVRDRYRLRVKVTDSGKPPLSSTTLVDIRVIEESVHPPAILPLEILVVVAAADAATGDAASGGYAGGVIGKVHATDQDVYDTLTYSLDPGADRLFSVTAAGGKLVARRGLEPGHYILNVTVTDGRFSALAEVTVRVRRLGRVLLDHSVAVLFPGLGPEEFVGDYWRDVRRALATILGVRRGHIHLLGLQPSEPPAPPALDALLLVEGPGGAPLAAGAVLRAINASAAELEELTGVRVLGAYRRLCMGLRCPGQLCRERVTLDQQVVSTHSTARLSFVTPRHHRTAQCLCSDGKCPVLSRGCENNPCPAGTDCVPDVEDEDAYTCVCPVTEGPCPGGSSVTFSGNGYVRYRLAERENPLELKLTLRLRTLAANGVIMYAQGTDYSILEVHHGRLQYRFDCGSGPGIVSVQSAQLDDGQWHAVSLDVAGNHARLVLDRVHSASGTAPGNLKTLNLDHHVYLGGHIHSSGLRPGRTPQPGGGFRGCLDSVVLNGQELPPPGVPPRSSAHIEAAVGVSPGCSLTAPGDCSVSPCQNGGTCFPSPSGGIYCKCPALYLGPFCEVSTDPCASNPCLYGGTCVVNSGDFSCQCRGRYSGHRCQLSPYCKFDPCQNGGTCFDSLDGAVCHCLHGFRGDRCQSDVDECMGNPCHNGALCENTPGSYRCNCSRAFRGQHCEDAVPNLYVSTPWNIGLAEGVGIVVFLAGVALLAAAFVACRRGLGRRRRQLPPNPEDKRPAVTAPFLHRPFLAGPPAKGGYPEVPPQVPVRPASYTPSVPSDSRNNLDRHSFEGSAIPEHPEFSTFSPDAGHGPRKAVAVCSVAPNLPPPPPSSSPSDSDSIRKPSWDFDYDAKEVELEPCLPKKALEEKGSQPYSARGSLSEVQSLSSFQSESCDDNGYHWDTSDWMPAVVLPDIQEFPHHEALEPMPLLADPSALEADYYPSGYDIESDFPPPPDDFPVPDDLPPLPPEFGDQFETLPPPRGGQRFDPSQYLPSFYPGNPSEGRQAGGGVGRGALGPFPAGLPRGTGAAATALAAGFAPSSSDLSACCELESEAALSDYESGDDDEGCPFDDAVIPPLDAQQHTQV
uniref:FAT atypical cadherin 1 n=1 Tax=Ornithorhynchus anatinus TaxID=9258 RepID=F6T585_ORNAN